MATMTIRQEVQATPKLVIEQLRAFLAATAETCFPHTPGTLLVIKSDYLQSLGGLADMPVLVIANPQHCPIGMVAVCRPSGDVFLGFVSAEHVVAVFDQQNMTSG